MEFLNALCLVLFTYGHLHLFVATVNHGLVQLHGLTRRVIGFVVTITAWIILWISVVTWIGAERFLTNMLGQGHWPQSLLAPWQWLVVCWPLGWVFIVGRQSEHALPEDITSQQNFLQIDKSAIPDFFSRWAALFDLSRIEITEIAIPVKNLPASFSGFQIMHLSDLHVVENNLSKMLLRYVLQLVREEKPDLIALTGDIASTGKWMGKAAEWIGKLTAPHGVWMVQGNHDWWAGAQRVEELLLNHDVRTLRNTGVRIEINGESVWLGGVDDFWSDTHEMSSALLGRRQDEVTVLLAHNPDHIMEAVEHGVDLQLSGHTHGGQILVPLIGPMVVPSKHGKRFIRGVHRVGDTTILVVNRGLAAYPPGRIGSGPQIIIIKLQQVSEI